MVSVFDAAIGYTFGIYTGMDGRNGGVGCATCTSRKSQPVSVRTYSVEQKRNGRDMCVAFGAMCRTSMAPV